MKVLVFAPYFYKKGRKEFEKNKTGFGMMVENICTYTGKKTEVSLLTHVITNGFETEDYRVLPHSKSDIFKSLTHVFKAIGYAFSFKNVPLKRRLRYGFYALTEATFKRCFNQIKPDVVHIHGATTASLPIVKYCLKNNVRFVVTLHGKIYNLEKVPTEDKQSEAFIYKNCPYVTVIGTGIKTGLCNRTGRSEEGVTVVNNGTEFGVRDCDADKLREELGIPKHKKVILSVGNISPWKNQIQTVRAFDMLDEETKENTVFVIVGIDIANGVVDRYIEEHGLSEKILQVGFVDKSRLETFYSAADCVVLASIEEGFGLSIIEGYTKGKPGIMFSDVDAAHDLYKEGALTLVSERTDEALCNAIKTVLNSVPNGDMIKEFAQTFSMEATADKYIGVYESI